MKIIQKSRYLSIIPSILTTIYFSWCRIWRISYGYVQLRNTLGSLGSWYGPSWILENTAKVLLIKSCDWLFYELDSELNKSTIIPQTFCMILNASLSCMVKALIDDWKTDYVCNELNPSSSIRTAHWVNYATFYMVVHVGFLLHTTNVTKMITRYTVVWNALNF